MKLVTTNEYLEDRATLLDTVMMMPLLVGAMKGMRYLLDFAGDVERGIYRDY